MNFLKLSFLIFIIFACKPKNDKKPDILISKSKMAKILAEIHELEGKISRLGIVNTDSSNFIYRKYEAQIFKKFEVDTSAYYQSFKYYLINPEDFTEIYRETVDILKENNKQDSIKNLKLKKESPDSSKIKNSDSLKGKKTRGNILNLRHRLDTIKALSDKKVKPFK